MALSWIGAGILGAILFTWCLPRHSERATLAAYPLSVKLRLFLPFAGWGDDLAVSDRESLQPINARVRVASALLPIVLIAGWYLSKPAEPIRSKPDPVDQTDVTPHPSPVAIEPTAPKTAARPHEPTIPTEPEVETLEEKRKQSRLYGTAKIKPIYRAHDVEGARVTQIQKGSFWDMLGVREGDVVIELHGEPVDTPAALVALMNALERDERVALRVRGTDDEVRYLEFRNPNPERR